MWFNRMQQLEPVNFKVQLNKVKIKVDSIEPQWNNKWSFLNPIFQYFTFCALPYFAYRSVQHNAAATVRISLPSPLSYFCNMQPLAIDDLILPLFVWFFFNVSYNLSVSYQVSLSLSLFFSLYLSLFTKKKAKEKKNNPQETPVPISTTTTTTTAKTTTK